MSRLLDRTFGLSLAQLDRPLPLFQFLGFHPLPFLLSPHLGLGPLDQSQAVVVARHRVGVFAGFGEGAVADLGGVGPDGGDGTRGGVVVLLCKSVGYGLCD